MRYVGLKEMLYDTPLPLQRAWRTDLFQRRNELRADGHHRPRQIRRSVVPAQRGEHQIRLLRQRRLHAAEHVVLPEPLQLQDTVLLLVEVPIDPAPHEVRLAVGEQAGDVGDVDVHDGHVVARLYLVMPRHRAVCPEMLRVVVRRL